MMSRRICKSFLAGVAFMAAAGRVAAGDCGGCGAAGIGGYGWNQAGAISASGAAIGGGCGPTTMTVNVTEYVDQQVPVTRTSYRTEYRDEIRNGTRTEWVPEVRTGTRTVYRNITETENVTRTYTVRIPVQEQRQGFETRWVSKQITETINVSVDRGHYEFVTVPVTGIRGSLAKLGHKLRNGCGNSFAASSDPCNPCPVVCEYVPTECKKVWVPCIVCEPKCITKCVKECIQVPTTYCVTTFKCETRTEVVPVCRTRCIPETQTYNYTVCTPKCVPFTWTAKVAVCVPFTETVMVCQKVPVTVQKQIVCNNSFYGDAGFGHGNGGGLFSGLAGRIGGLFRNCSLFNGFGGGCGSSFGGCGSSCGGCATATACCN